MRPRHASTASLPPIASDLPRMLVLALRQSVFRFDVSPMGILIICIGEHFQMLRRALVRLPCQSAAFPSLLAGSLRVHNDKAREREYVSGVAKSHWIGQCHIIDSTCSTRTTGTSTARRTSIPRTMWKPSASSTTARTAFPPSCGVAGERSRASMHGPRWRRP